MMMDNAGKDKDPSFDLRKNLIANLGDDVITYQGAAQQTLEDLNSPPRALPRRLAARGTRSPRPSRRSAR